MKEFLLENNGWQLVFIGIVSYLMGCINFGWITSRLMKKDITKMGSGNPGTMNVTRELGIKAGVCTFAGDALKGVVPMLVCHFIYRQYYFENTLISVADFMRYFAGMCVVIGHIFPISRYYKGGKGIATTLGIFWCGLSLENPWWIVGGLGVAVILITFISVTHWGSLGSLLGVSGCSVIQFVIFFNRYLRAGVFMVNAYLVCLFMFVFALIVLTWWAHRKNLQRLFVGEEHRTSFIKRKKP